MRILIIHVESKFFAGAEKMLLYFLDAVRGHPRLKVEVAVAKDSRLSTQIPTGMPRSEISPCEEFSLVRLSRQCGEIRRLHRTKPFDLFHGWAARDWELTALAGFLNRRPTVGTLHDHPEAPFIRPRRRHLMRVAVQFGLTKVICVSDAVRNEAIRCGYPPAKLLSIHNGVPGGRNDQARSVSAAFRVGFLGAFSYRKGLKDFFAMAALLFPNRAMPLELHLAGGAQDPSGEDLLNKIRTQYSPEWWWERVVWHGWVGQPSVFLRSLDLLVVPSAEFDPFPTVLLEAAQAGLAVVATRLGGIPEIVADGVTGWLFAPGDAAAAASCIERVWTENLAPAAGEAALQRAASSFSPAKMVAAYEQLYSNILAHV